MNEEIIIEHGARSISVPRADYITAEKILRSAMIRQELGHPENAVLKDGLDNVITGSIPSTVGTVRIDRQAGGKNR